MLEQSIDRIVEQTYISRYKVIKALTYVRTLMLIDVPGIFEGIVEVDETYIGWTMEKQEKSSKAYCG